VRKMNGIKESQVDAIDSDGSVKWWRFSAYEVVAGVIRPARQARLEEYDPWVLYTSSRSGEETVPPYQSLVNLLRSTRFRPFEDGFVLDAESEGELLAWCDEFGLLGILPQRIMAIALPPTVKVGPWTLLDDTVDPEMMEECLLLEWKSYYRVGASWRTDAFGDKYSTHATRELIRALKRHKVIQEEGDEVFSSGDLGVSRTNLSSLPFAGPPRTWMTEGAVLAELDEPGIRHLSLSESLAPFFPSVPASERELFQYPRPLSSDFWSAYAEPVGEFIQTAQLLKRVLSSLYQLETETPEILALYGPSPSYISGELERLTAGTSRVATWHAGGQWWARWKYPSLLSALAMMITEDLAAGRRPRLCEECGTPFLTSAYQARYCSLRCRNTAQKRRYRQKKRVREGGSTS
jgi:hypothetical protein